MTSDVSKLNGLVVLKPPSGAKVSKANAYVILKPEVRIAVPSIVNTVFFSEEVQPTHRHWRIFFTDVWSSSLYCALAEVQFRQNIGVFEPVVGMTTDAGSYSSAYNGSKATDGNPSTYWYGQRTSGVWWLAVDFGENGDRVIREIWIKSSIDGNYGRQGPMAFDLQHSDDGSTWTTAYTFSDIPEWTNGVERSFSVPA